ncbi:unnamed protein product [marine sediment metagenome]|uniref:PIN domain-containing protein n=1 Tax=marine sediment metagenome TaxID=412755 RepID=X0W7Z4_9ZZZZ
MKIVLDTNVLVAGLLNPYGPPGRIVNLVAAGEVSLCFDARITGEYREVLRRPKFPFRPEQIDALLEQVRAAGEPAAANALAQPLPDHDDEPFLEVAIAADAKYLVTGNSRHFPARLSSGVQVVSPAKFLEIYRRQTQ